MVVDMQPNRRGKVVRVRRYGMWRFPRLADPGKLSFQIGESAIGCFHADRIRRVIIEPDTIPNLSGTALRPSLIRNIEVPERTLKPRLCGVGGLFRMT